MEKLEPLFIADENVKRNSHWKTVWQVLRQLNIELLYHSAISFLGRYLKGRKARTQTGICLLMFMASLFTIAKRQKHLLIDEWINKCGICIIWNIVVQLPSCVRPFTNPWAAGCQASLSLTIPQSLEYYSALKRKGILIHVMIQMSLEDIMLSDMSLSQKGQILSDSTYVRNLEQLNSQRQKVEWWLPEEGEGRGCGVAGLGQ